METTVTDLIHSYDLRREGEARRELDSVIRVTRAARDGRKEGAKCIKT